MKNTQKIKISKQTLKNNINENKKKGACLKLSIIQDD